MARLTVAIMAAVLALVGAIPTGHRSQDLEQSQHRYRSQSPHGGERRRQNFFSKLRELKPLYDDSSFSSTVSSARDLALAREPQHRKSVLSRVNDRLSRLSAHAAQELPPAQPQAASQRTMATGQDGALQAPSQGRQT
jgi:hypothetical protein